jgi:hypothetical protein
MRVDFSNAMRSLARTIAFLGLLALCCESKQESPKRVELKKVPGGLVELVPKEGADPYCLVFTISENGVTRQLTMSDEDKSIPCPPGVAIGGTPYRIPRTEGKVRIYVFFSSEKLVAGSVARQINEVGANPSFTVLDLRLPGKVTSEVLEYAPTGGASP